MFRRTVQIERSAIATVVVALLTVVFIPEAHAGRGRVRIESTPPNAAIYVDDKAGGIKGYTPTMLRVQTGTRKIILELDGYKPLEQFIEVKPRRKTYRMTLEKLPETAHLNFVADPTLADGIVLVDGEDKGTLKDDIEIPAGRHLIEVTKAGYQKWSRWFELDAGEKRDVDVKLEADVADVKVTAQPSVKDGFVYINDENKGAAPWAGKLAPGKYKIEIKAPGFSSTPQTVLVETGQKADVNVQMIDESEKDKIGKISVASEPAVSGALVYIDDVNKGPSPFSGVVPSGHHKIEVRAPNYACGPETIFIEGNKQTAVTVKLYPIAKLNASVNVDRAEVFIDESSIGFTPLEDLEIPAKRSTLYIRKDGYKEYQEVIFPKKGDTVTVNATLEFAPAEGMNNYLSLAFDFGLFGPTKLESDIRGIDDESTTYKPSDTKMAVGLRYTRLFNPYIGFGLNASFTYLGLGGDLALHVDPMLRLQVPVTVEGRRFVELYLGVAVGMTAYFNTGDPRKDDLYEPGEDDEEILDAAGDRTGAAFGWNLMTPLGLQFNVAHFLGIFIEGSWKMHKVYGKMDVNSGPDSYKYSWMEVAVGGGLVFIF